MDIRAALQELADDIKNEILRRLRSDIGVNPRTGTNTLQGSQLEKSIDVYPRSEKTLVFQIADYYEYVVKGWKRTHRGKGTFQEYLINIKQWIQRKHIHWGNMTENQMMWALAKRMFDERKPYTIKARPFIEYDVMGDVSKILPFLDEFFNNWADRIFNELMIETDNYFNS